MTAGEGARLVALYDLRELAEAHREQGTRPDPEEARAVIEELLSRLGCERVVEAWRDLG